MHPKKSMLSCNLCPQQFPHNFNSISTHPCKNLLSSSPTTDSQQNTDTVQLLRKKLLIILPAVHHKVKYAQIPAVMPPDFPTPGQVSHHRQHVRSLVLVFSSLLCFPAPCTRLRWLSVSFWAHVTVTHRIISWSHSKWEPTTLCFMGFCWLPVSPSSCRTVVYMHIQST